MCYKKTEKSKSCHIFYDCYGARMPVYYGNIISRKSNSLCKSCKLKLNDLIDCDFVWLKILHAYIDFLDGRKMFE